MNTEGIEALYRKHGDMAYRVCLRYAKNREDVEDLVHETFIKVSRSLQDFQEDSSSLTWIYRIAANCCLDYLRARKRKNLLSSDFALEKPDEVSRPEDEKTLAKMTLQKVLAEVEPETRKILFFAFEEGLSHMEISKILGVSKATVTLRLKNFKEKMQKKAGRFRFFCLLFIGFFFKDFIDRFPVSFV